MTTHKPVTEWLDLAERLAKEAALHTESAGRAMALEAHCSPSRILDLIAEVRRLQAENGELRRDKERLDFIEKDYCGGGVLSDDAGRWAVAATGFQPFVEGSPIAGEWIIWCEAEDWKPSIRAAIDAALSKSTEGGE